MRIMQKEESKDGRQIWGVPHWTRNVISLDASKTYQIWSRWQLIFCFCQQFFCIWGKGDFVGNISWYKQFIEVLKIYSKESKNDLKFPNYASDLDLLEYRIDRLQKNSKYHSIQNSREENIDFDQEIAQIRNHVNILKDDLLHDLGSFKKYFEPVEIKPPQVNLPNDLSTNQSQVRKNIDCQTKIQTTILNSDDRRIEEKEESKNFESTWDTIKIKDF